MADREQQLRIRKQQRHFIHALIAQLLADALGNHRGIHVAGVGALGLDHGDWNAVNETHHIRSPRVRTLCRQDLELVAHFKTVRFRMLPIDDGNGRLMFLPIRHELGDGDAQVELFIQPLIGSGQAFLQGGCRQLANDLIDRVGRQWMELALIGKAAGLQYFHQRGLEDDFTVAAALAQADGWCQVSPAQCA